MSYSRRPNNNKKTNKKNTKDGYEPIHSCNGCGTDVFYSHQVKHLLETRTRFVHDKHRCDLIISRKKLEQREKDAKTLRLDIVEEIKQKLLEFHPAVDDVEKLYEIMKHRKHEIDAVSIRELAAAFYPDEVYVNINGDREPTHRAIETMSRRLHKLRKVKDEFGQPVNYATVVFSRVFNNGEWFFYNMQTHTDFEKVKERLTKQVDGVEQTLERTERILAESEAERLDAERLLDEHFANKKRKREQSS